MYVNAIIQWTPKHHTFVGESGEIHYKQIHTAVEL